MAKKIIILGKPNVGKSSLFNRLLKDKIAITSEIEGTTRDINIRPLELENNGRIFYANLCDTAGLMKKADGIFKNVKKIIFDFINEGDLILYVISAEQGIIDEDLRTFRSLKNAVLIVNKTDIQKVERWEYGAFGAKNVFFVSSLHNRGLKQLKDFLADNLSFGMQSAGFANEVKQPFRTCEIFGDFADPKSSLNPQNFHKYKSHTANTSIVDSASAESNETQNSQSNNRSNGGVALHCFDTERAKIGLGRPLSEVSYQNNANEYPRTNCKQDESATINIGIIGRVNVGKSSILNALLNKNRSLVSEVEGTTIDPVSDEIAYKGKILRFVDTAGIRRASKIEGIEKFALIRTKNILEQSNIVLLVLDSSQDFVELDEKISGLSQKYNLGIIILLNKWDIKCADFKAIETQIRRKFAYLAYAPILTISALKMRHIDEIKEAILRVWENFNRRIPTATLNSHLKIATQKHPIPSDKGKIIKVYYATQVDCAPPTIILSMNRPRALHFSYKRYLVNYFRANFDFSGVPIVILTKGRDKGEMAE